MTTILPIQTSERMRGGLESVARPLLGMDGQPLAEAQWRGGVMLTPGSQDAGFVWPVSCTATPELRVDEDLFDDGKPAETGVSDGIVFDPLVVGAMSACLPGRTVFGDLQRAMATSTLERIRFSKLAEALFTGGMGASDESNPSLLAVNGATPAGFDATSPSRIRPTMAGLLNAVCGYSGSDWVFHAPIQMLAHVKNELGLVWNDTRGVWTWGPFDWSFDCYPNSGPTEVEDVTPTEVDGTTFWVWMTRRPMVAWSDDVTVLEATKHLENHRKVLAEQVAIIVVDTTAVLAAKVLAQS